MTTRSGDAPFVDNVSIVRGDHRDGCESQKLIKLGIWVHPWEFRQIVCRDKLGGFRGLTTYWLEFKCADKKCKSVSMLVSEEWVLDRAIERADIR